MAKSKLVHRPKRGIPTLAGLAIRDTITDQCGKPTVYRWDRVSPTTSAATHWIVYDADGNKIKEGRYNLLISLCGNRMQQVAARARKRAIRQSVNNQDLLIVRNLDTSRYSLTLNLVMASVFIFPLMWVLLNGYSYLEPLFTMPSDQSTNGSIVIPALCGTILLATIVLPHSIVAFSLLIRTLKYSPAQIVSLTHESIHAVLSNNSESTAFWDNLKVTPETNFLRFTEGDSSIKNICLGTGASRIIELIIDVLYPGVRAELIRKQCLRTCRNIALGTIVVIALFWPIVGWLQDHGELDPLQLIHVGAAACLGYCLLYIAALYMPSRAAELYLAWQKRRRNRRRNQARLGKIPT